MPESKKLSVEPYKGTRDFYPHDQFIQNYIFSVWRSVAQKYGYLEYNASILEETELYKAKSGEEIVNEQTYSFTDRGGREVTIRPEMTPTVARMVAQKRKELSFPLRWFSIPNLFRYERPQRGRLREHWQLNVDMFGVESTEADLEVVRVSSDIMKAFGATDDQFKIKLNSRKLLNYLMHEYLMLTGEQAYKLSKLIDRMHKISGEEFAVQLHGIVEKEDQERKILEVVRAGNIDQLPDELKTHESVFELQVFLDRLKNLGVENAEFDISLVRGFDYYTGIVFEVNDTSPVNPRALFGGGRYDDLVGIFGVDKVPGVGFGMGDVTIRDFLETYNLLPPYRPATDLYICPFDISFVEPANKLARDLRLQGLNVAVDLTDRKIAAKVKTADREQIPWVVVIGQQELDTDSYKVKHLKESKEYEVKSSEIEALINRM